MIVVVGLEAGEEAELRGEEAVESGSGGTGDLGLGVEGFECLVSEGDAKGLGFLYLLLLHAST